MVLVHSGLLSKPPLKMHCARWPRREKSPAARRRSCTNKGNWTRFRAIQSDREQFTALTGRFGCVSVPRLPAFASAKCAIKTILLPLNLVPMEPVDPWNDSRPGFVVSFFGLGCRSLRRNTLGQ